MKTKSLGGFIRETRQKDKISLRSLAMRIGIDHAFLSQIELDKRNPPGWVLDALAEKLNVSIHDLSIRHLSASLRYFETELRADRELAMEFANFVEALKGRKIGKEDLRRIFQVKETAIGNPNGCCLVPTTPRTKRQHKMLSIK